MKDHAEAALPGEKDNDCDDIDGGYGGDNDDDDEYDDDDDNNVDDDDDDASVKVKMTVRLWCWCSSRDAATEFVSLHQKCHLPTFNPCFLI